MPPDDEAIATHTKIKSIDTEGKSHFATYPSRIYTQTRPINGSMRLRVRESSTLLASIRKALAGLTEIPTRQGGNRLVADGLVARPTQWPSRLRGASLLCAALEAREVHALSLGDKALAYVDPENGTVHVISEGPKVVQLRDVAAVIEELGAEIVSVNKADVVQTPEGYAGNIGGHHASGGTIAEAALRSWLIERRAAQQGVETFSALEYVDLTLAKRVINELAKQDGDLGAEYWSAVSRLLTATDQMREALAVIQAELQ